MNELSVILAVNVTVFSTCVILFGIGFNFNIDFTGSNTLSPSNSNEVLTPSFFWMVNAVNSYVPSIEKKLSTFFGIVLKIPSELDIDPTR